MRATEKSIDERAAAERAEREEMFSFHPMILTEAGPLPRRSGDSTYVDPEGDVRRGDVQPEMVRRVRR